VLQVAAQASRWGWHQREVEVRKAMPTLQSNGNKLKRFSLKWVCTTGHEASAIFASCYFI